MKTYVQPTLTENEDAFEGIYTASGNKKESASGYSCDSKYMNGTYVIGTYTPINDGYKKGRGCEGCPANYGNSCGVSQVNYDGDFRPSWEVQGHLPNEKGY